ncbi:MAG: GTPase Era [Chloroflexi bacterium]|nr:MAG: GTPase Era [Chloroflexota bacterium]
MNDFNDELDSIFADDWPEDHRSGIVAVIGRPNVGKSTLINRILGEKIAIVAPKPQTTRKQQLGIYTVEKGQIIFIDTPGIHKPHHKLGEYMVQEAQRALRDADLIMWIMDLTEPPTPEDFNIADLLKGVEGETPIIIVLNKVDLCEETPDTVVYTELVAHERVFTISAQEGLGVNELVEYLLERLPLGPRFYPAEQITERNMRFTAAEIIREKVILHTEKEIPHAVAVVIDSYREYENRVEITAAIYVERDSQKGILIGKGGQMIKRIGSEARQELIQIVGMPVQLDLRVKVLKNWRKDPNLTKRLGYSLPKGKNKGKKR